MKACNRKVKTMTEEQFWRIVSPFLRSYYGRNRKAEWFAALHDYCEEHDVLHADGVFSKSGFVARIGEPEFRDNGQVAIPFGVRLRPFKEWKANRELDCAYRYETTPPPTSDEAIRRECVQWLSAREQQQTLTQTLQPINA